MKLKKKKKGHYIILENDEEVGYVYEGYVGRLGYSHYRWRGEYKGKNIHGATRKEALGICLRNIKKEQ